VNHSIRARDRERHLRPGPDHRKHRASRRGSVSITGQCNAMGTREAGFSSRCPDIASSRAPPIARSWGIVEHRHGADSSSRGCVSRHHRGAVATRIRALWIIAPIRGFLPQHRCAEAGFRKPGVPGRAGRLPTPTRNSPTWFLRLRPGAKKKARTPTPSPVSKANKAVEPPGDANRTSIIFISPAKSWGARMSFFPDGPVADAFEEWRRVSAGRPCDYSA